VVQSVVFSKQCSHDDDDDDDDVVTVVHLNVQRVLVHVCLFNIYYYEGQSPD